ncbi:MAG: hypothetical protein ACRCYS_07200 [Beijerinckiaceae bacterium]
MFYAIVADSDNSVIAVSASPIAGCFRYHSIVELVGVGTDGIAYDHLANEFDVSGIAGIEPIINAHSLQFTLDYLFARVVDECPRDKMAPGEFYPAMIASMQTAIGELA